MRLYDFLFYLGHRYGIWNNGLHSVCPALLFDAMSFLMLLKAFFNIDLFMPPNYILGISFVSLVIIVYIYYYGFHKIDKIEAKMEAKYGNLSMWKPPVYIMAITMVHLLFMSLCAMFAFRDWIFKSIPDNIPEFIMMKLQEFIQ